MKAVLTKSVPHILRARRKKRKPSLIFLSWFCSFLRPHHLRPRRPAKFRDRCITRSWSRDSHFSPQRRFSSALRSFQQNKKRVCFSCRQEVHFLCNCPECERYRSQLNAFVNLGQTAAYILDHENSNADESDHELLDFFDDTVDVTFSELD